MAFVLKSVARRHTSEGKCVGYVLASEDGQEFTVDVPYQDIPDLMTAIELGAVEAREMTKTLLKGVDPRVFEPIKAWSCRRIDVLWSEDQVVLGILTDKGMPLNLAMGQAKAESLAERIREAIAAQRSGTPKPS